MTDGQYAALLRTAAGLLAACPAVDWLTAQADKPTPDPAALNLAASVVNAHTPKPRRRWRIWRNR